MISSLSSNVVIIHRLNLTHVGSFDDSVWQQLTGEEQRRAKRLRVASAQNQFVLTRTWLRSVLANYCELRAIDIPLAYSNHGKPHLDHPELSRFQFNLTHSRDIALLAITLDRPVGIDLEWIDPKRDFQALASRYYSPKEQAWLKQFEDDKLSDEFYHIWVRKEAWLKAMGKGITMALEAMDVEMQNAPTFTLSLPNTDGLWSGCDLQVASAYQASLVLFGDTPFQVSMAPSHPD